MIQPTDAKALLERVEAKLMERHEVYHASYRNRNSIHLGSDHVQGLSDGVHEAIDIVRAVFAEHL